jgi:hypothetical protein
MTARLSHSTHHNANPIGIQGIGNQINACRCVTRGRKHIGSTWSRNTCLDSALATAQSLLLQDLEGFQSSQRLINNNQRQAIHTINKTLHRTVPCFAIDFPLLGVTEYPQTPFTVAKISPYWVQHNTLRPYQSCSSNKTNSLEPS